MGTEWTLSKFTDDIKPGVAADITDAYVTLQSDLLSWTERNFIMFNTEKCEVLHIGGTACTSTYSVPTGCRAVW